MRNKFLLDTNILIQILQKKMDLINFLEGSELFISFMTELEVLSFHEISKAEEQQIYYYLSNIKIIEFNTLIKNETIKLRRKYKTKIADTIILATSNFLEIPVITSDKTLQKSKDDVRVILWDI